jgi:tungstate transport system substrate-binding protein
MKKCILAILALLLCAAVFTGCGRGANTGTITLATTTSTEDSGLLDFLLPHFTDDTGWEVRVISVGTGAALQLGRDGEADVLLVHARAEEDRFVNEGYADRRYDVMHNDFIIAGPAHGVIGYNNDPITTFRAIYEQGLDFLSRGDNSGTHIKELEVWEAVGIADPYNNPSYHSVGQGMGATLAMAVEMDAYILTDRATWLNFPNKGSLVIVSEFDPILNNPYGMMIVSTTDEPEGARVFVDWLTGDHGQYLIGNFGVYEFGAPLFFPYFR